METKAAKTLGIIVGGFIVCWLPFFTMYLIRAFCEECIHELLFSVLFWLGYCNSAINPLIYALFSNEFRAAFTSIICQCLCRRPRSSVNSTGGLANAMVTAAATAGLGSTGSGRTTTTSVVGAAGVTSSSGGGDSRRESDVSQLQMLQRTPSTLSHKQNPPPSPSSTYSLRRKRPPRTSTVALGNSSSRHAGCGNNGSVVLEEQSAELLVTTPR